MLLTHTKGISGSIVQLTMLGASGQGGFINCPVPYDSNWHQIAVSVNTQNGGEMLIDGVLNNSISQSWTGIFGVDLGQKILIGGEAVNGRTIPFPFLGNIADLTVWAGTTYVDLTDPNVQAALFDGANETPNRIGPTGWLTLSPIYPGLAPQICLSGPASQFMQNLASRTFNPLGGGFGFTPGGFQDTSPTSMFTNTAGTLATAPSDPWSDPA
jgi:hypothetical protein